VTLVLPKAPIIPDLVTAGMPTVALRMPAHEQAARPDPSIRSPDRLAHPSANPFGYVSPTCAEHVVEQLGDAVDHDRSTGGACAFGIESTIVDPQRGRGAHPSPWRHRLRSDLLGARPDRRGGRRSDEGCAGFAAATLLATGFDSGSSRARVPPPPPTGSSGLVLSSDLGRCRRLLRGGEILSRHGDPAEVAHHLFATLRRLDKTPLELVVAELAPEMGLGRAINDRLRAVPAYRGRKATGGLSAR
jgi:L-threonylcarbamoyladenylate synthase